MRDVQLSGPFDGQRAVTPDTPPNRRPDFKRADLRNSDMRLACLDGSDFGGASLKGARFYNVDLSQTDFRDCRFSGSVIDGEFVGENYLLLTGFAYWVLITPHKMRIGCESFTHEEWRSLSDEQIDTLEVGAVAFWATWKPLLLSACDTIKQIAETQTTKE